MKRTVCCWVLMAAVAGLILSEGWIGNEAFAQYAKTQPAPAPVTENGYFTKERPDLPANHPYRQTQQPYMGANQMPMGGLPAQQGPNFGIFYRAQEGARTSFAEEQAREQQEREEKLQDIRLKRCQQGQQEFCF